MSAFGKLSFFDRSYKYLLLVALLAFSVFVGLTLVFFKPVAFGLITLFLVAVAFVSRLTFIVPMRLLRWLLGLFVLTSLFWPRYLAFDTGGPDVTVPRLILVVLLGVWSLSLFSADFAKASLKEISGFGLALLFFILYLFIRLVSSVGSDFALSSLYLWTNEFVSVLVIFLIAATVFSGSVRSWVRESVFGKWVILLIVVFFVLALIEQLIQQPLFASINLPGIKVDGQFFSNSVSVKIRDGAYRSQATLSHPLVLAQLVVFLSAFIPHAYVLQKNRLNKLLVLVSGIFALSTVLMTGSRAAILALFLVWGIALFLIFFHSARSTFYSKVLVSFCGAIFFLVVLTLLIDGSILNKVTDLAFGRSQLEAQSTSARLVMLERALKVASDHALIGNGLGVAPLLVGVRGTGSIITVDSYYITLLVESGYIGLALFLLFWIFVIYKAIAHIGSHGLFYISVIAALVGQLFFISVLSITELHFLMFFLAAFVVGSAKPATKVQ